MGKNIPPIAEKVKFWEEQDKINQAVIPRLIEMNESIKNIAMQLGEVDKKIAFSESRTKKSIKEDLAKSIDDLNSRIANIEGNIKSLDESTSTLKNNLIDLKLEVLSKLNVVLFPEKYKIIIYITFLISLISLLISIFN